MVGVAGKYKGCNTCRLRRVKCDNGRPKCRKCIDSGRECKGYERETIFIVGTISDGGRCSSHPPRVLKNSKKAKSPPKTDENERLELVPVGPLQPAWNDSFSISRARWVYQVQVAALNTSLQAVVRNDVEGHGQKALTLSLPSYTPIACQPTCIDEDYELRSQCLVHLPSPEGRDTPESATRDSFLLFLYQHNSIISSAIVPPWVHAQTNRIRQLGPEYFRTFPAHHFFVRLYRPHAIYTALLNRGGTFLAEPEWMTVPWECYPKPDFDRLLDIIALIPSILSRADSILPHDPTLARRLMAQDLLQNTQNIQDQLNQWHTTVLRTAGRTSQLFWLDHQDNSDAHIPWVGAFAFCDGLTALMFVYFWSALVIFYPCVDSLQCAIYDPVLDAFPQSFPNLPSTLHIDPQRYSNKEVSEMAANVCRSLDFALNATVQPDLLVAPVHVVGQFYNTLNTISNFETGDGALELLWLEEFKQRLLLKGQDIADGVQRKTWRDYGEF